MCHHLTDPFTGVCTDHKGGCPKGLGPFRGAPGASGAWSYGIKARGAMAQYTCHGSPLKSLPPPSIPHACRCVPWCLYHGNSLQQFPPMHCQMPALRIPLAGGFLGHKRCGPRSLRSAPGWDAATCVAGIPCTGVPPSMLAGACTGNSPAGALLRYAGFGPWSHWSTCPGCQESMSSPKLPVLSHHKQTDIGHKKEVQTVTRNPHAQRFVHLWHGILLTQIKCSPCSNRGDTMSTQTRSRCV